MERGVDVVRRDDEEKKWVDKLEKEQENDRLITDTYSEGRKWKEVQKRSVMEDASKNDKNKG